MIESSTIIELTKHFKTQAGIARAVGVSPSAVSQWIRRGTIPADCAIAIERASEGKFKAIDLV